MLFFNKSLRGCYAREQENTQMQRTHVYINARNTFTIGLFRVWTLIYVYYNFRRLLARWCAELYWLVVAHFQNLLSIHRPAVSSVALQNAARPAVARFVSPRTTRALACNLWRLTGFHQFRTNIMQIRHIQNNRLPFKKQKLLGNANNGEMRTDINSNFISFLC